MLCMILDWSSVLWSWSVSLVGSGDVDIDDVSSQKKRDDFSHLADSVFSKNTFEVINEKKKAASSEVYSIFERESE